MQTSALFRKILNSITKEQDVNKDINTAIGVLTNFG
jgi:hypothetical protein